MALLPCFGKLFIHVCISRHNPLDLEIDSPNAIGWKLYILVYTFVYIYSGQKICVTMENTYSCHCACNMVKIILNIYLIEKQMYTYIYIICVRVVTHAIWRTHSCNRACSHAWYDSFICVTWLIHMCDMTPSCVFMYTFDSCVWHDSFSCRKMDGCAMQRKTHQLTATDCNTLQHTATHYYTLQQCGVVCCAMYRI